MLAVVLDGELVEAFLAGVVLDRDGSVAVVLDHRFVHVTAGHLDVGWKEGGFETSMGGDGILYEARYLYGSE